jgi:hypothetical protein
VSLCSSVSDADLPFAKHEVADVIARLFGSTFVGEKSVAVKLSSMVKMGESEPIK